MNQRFKVVEGQLTIERFLAFANVLHAFY